MLGITLANLRAHKGRLLLSSVAIVVATAFVAGTFVFTDAMRTAYFGMFAKDLGQAEVVVTAPDDADVPEQALAAVRQVDGVTYAERRVTWSGALRYRDGRLMPAKFVSVAPKPALGWPEVTRGRLPDQRGEVVLDRSTAKRNGFSVGDTVPVPRDWEGPNANSRKTRALRIVGLVNVGDSPRYGGQPFLGMTKEQARALTDNRRLTMVLAVGAEGVSAAQLADRIDTAVGSPYQARTAEKHTRMQA